MKKRAGKLLTGAVLAGVFGAAASVASAAPLLNVQLLGRAQGSADAFSSSVTVAPGATIEYQLVADIAPVGTTNSQGGGRTINSSSTSTDGVNALQFNILQNDNDPDANFAAAAVLETGWGAGTGASGGTPGSGNLTGVRPARSAGSFLGADPVVFATGTFTVPTATDSASQVVMAWNGSGSIRINGSTTVFLSNTTETNADPIVGFAPLNLVVPEPTSLGLLGVGGLGLLARRRRPA